MDARPENVDGLSSITRLGLISPDHYFFHGDSSEMWNFACQHELSFLLPYSAYRQGAR
jgi:hypothetical protein